MANEPSTLKIGLVLDDSLDTPDGVQQYVLTLGKWLSSQGHDVHYLVGATTRTDMPQVHSLSRNVKVRFNGNRMSMPLPSNRAALKQLLQQEQFDVLHVQMPYSPFMAGRIVKVAPARTAVVGTFHIAPNSRLVTLANHGLKLLVTRSLRRFDAVMSVSPIAQSFARQTFGIESTIVPNLVALQPFLKAQPLSQYPKNVPTIMFLGRLVARKGCQHLLNAIVYLQEHFPELPPYKVLVCGKGPLEAELKAYAKQHAIDHLVEFVGFVQEADKPSYMASADISVFPSAGGESFGIVVVEAMAAARGAVLAGDNPGYASVMAEHNEALFVPAAQKVLAEKLAALLADPTARAKARQWQRQSVMRFDAPTVGRQVVQQYTAALHKRRA